MGRHRSRRTRAAVGDEKKEKQCTDKIRYAREEWADEQVDNLARRNKTRYTYYCPLCCGWHLTKLMPREEQVTLTDLLPDEMKEQYVVKDIAIRRMTDEEISYEWDKHHKLNEKFPWDDSDEDPIYRWEPASWVICMADDPERVLKSFWSPVGHWLLPYALDEVEKRKGKFNYVGLLTPRLWQDEGDQA